MGDLLGSFPESVRVRSKHGEKTRVGLWGQSIIPKAVWDVTNGIRARPLPVRCGSRTNHAEAGGHVTPEAEEGEGVVAPHVTHEAKEGKGGRHIGMRGILMLCRYGTAWLMESL